MARLQIGLEGSWVGRGFFRKLFGSGPFRVTPVDVAIAGGDVGRVATAVQVIGTFIGSQPVGRFRVGSLIDLAGVRLFLTVKAD